MYSHATPDYICPICLGVKGVESEATLLKQADLVYEDELVSAFINSFWIPTCEGHVIVVPNDHYENLYTVPEVVGQRIFIVSQKIALAMRNSYECAGTTLRQNNEPAGNQHAFHYHLHVFPRYVGDNFNFNMTQKSVLSDPNKRVSYREKLVSALTSQNGQSSV